jgi:uncharacterized membrane protein
LCTEPRRRQDGQIDPPDAKEHQVSTLTVRKFDTADGAAQALRTLADLAKQELIKVQDGATVSWAEGARKPKTRQANDLVAAGALGGMFWGMLFGLIFLNPILGAAVGAASGALSGSLTDIGISDDFIKSVKASILPGTSALFAMTSDAVQDKVSQAFAGHNAQLIHTNLSKEQEDNLREMFAA